MKRVTPKLGRDFVCGKCERGVGGMVEQVEKLSDAVETVKEFSYLEDRVDVSDGCEAALRARA